MMPAMFRLIWPSGFRGGDFKKMAIQKQELPVEGRLEMDHNKMCTLQRGPSIDASY
jgi:hypothetical protein